MESQETYPANLRRQLEELEFLRTSLDDIVFTLDPLGRFLELYGTWAMDLDREVYIGKTAIDLLGEKNGSPHKTAFLEALTHGNSRFTWSWTSNEGDTIYYDTKLTALFKDGKVQKILGVARDVTELVSIQQALSRLQKRYEFVFDAMQAGIWEWHVPSGLLQLNDQMLCILGRTRDEMNSFSFDDWMNMTHPDDLSTILKLFDEHVHKGTEYYNSQIRMKHKNGSWVWVLNMGAVFEWDGDGNPVRVIGANVDVTNEVNTHSQLNSYQQQYKAIFERSAYPKLIEQDGKIILCNHAAAESLHYWHKDELVGKSIREISPEKQSDGRLSATAARAIIDKSKEEGSLTFEWEHLTRNGESRIFEVTLIQSEKEDSRFVEWRDITEKKLNEEMLIEAYQERGVLLSEIHHRVKNNLAAVTGLLQLQKIHAGNDFVSQSLDKSIQRISTIAQLHKELYTNKEYKSIQLDTHISMQLETLRDIYQDQNPELYLETDLDKVSLPMRQAMPVGLLVNEILTNSFKYAFAGRDSGVIRLSLKEHESGEIVLEISDNGIGISNATEPGEWSLGTTLIESFASQLDGTLEKLSDEGTGYRLSFMKERS